MELTQTTEILTGMDCEATEITCDQITPGTESHSSDQVKNETRKITVIAPRNGSSMAPNFFSPITSSNDEVHCYFPYSDKIYYSMGEMISKIKQENPTKKIHHIEITLACYNTGNVPKINSIPGTLSSSSRESGISSTMSNDSSDDSDSDGQWTDISTDEMDQDFDEDEESLSSKPCHSQPRQVITREENRKDKMAATEKREPGQPPKAVRKSTRNIVCAESGENFSAPCNLERHMNSHLTERTIKCSLCDKAFKNPCHLRRHNFIVHMKSSHTCSCDKCGRTFPFPYYLRKHEKKCQKSRC